MYSLQLLLRNAHVYHKLLKLLLQDDPSHMALIRILDIKKQSQLVGLLRTKYSSFVNCLSIKGDSISQ